MRRSGPGALLVLLLSAVALPAWARSMRSLIHRVDLRTGAVSLLADAWAGRPRPRARTPPRAAWWRPTAGGRQAAIQVRIADDVDPPVQRPARRDTLAVIAEGEVRLRVPAPDDHGLLLWEVLEGDMLVVAWLSEGVTRFGIDLSVGRVRWSRRDPTADPRGDHGRSAGQGRIFVVGAQAFTALDAATGATLWRLPRAPDDSAANVVLCDGTSGRWVIATDAIVSVDAATGATIWRASPGPGLAGWCFAQGDRLFVDWRRGAGTAQADVLMAFSRDDGRTLWRRAPGPLLDTGLAVGDAALVTWTSDALLRVDRGDGATLWTMPATHLTGVEVLSDGDWFLPEGGCTRLDARTGAVRWKLGSPCRRVGETALVTAALDRAGIGAATVTLARYAFGTRALIGRRVIHRYTSFFDMGAVDVLAIEGGAAIVASEFTVLD